MNNITIKEPEPRAGREPQQGDLFRRPDDASGDVYVLHQRGGGWVAVNIVTGGYWRETSSIYHRPREKAVLGLRPLPPGTVITITVE